MNQLTKQYQDDAHIESNLESDWCGAVRYGYTQMDQSQGRFGMLRLVRSWPYFRCLQSANKINYNEIISVTGSHIRRVFVEASDTDRGVASGTSSSVSDVFLSVITFIVFCRSSFPRFFPTRLARFCWSYTTTRRFVLQKCAVYSM